MRNYLTIRILLTANLVWATGVFYMCCMTSSDKNSPLSKENFAQKNDERGYQRHGLAIATLKRLLRLKYPNEDDLITSYLDRDLPTIYAVTPTYTRWTQKAELTRLCQTFLHVPNFQWIIVEDSESRTDLVARFLKACGLPYVHLFVKTVEDFKMKPSDPNWLMPRGVSQRNEALKWIRNNVASGTPGVLYFVDDDNTYSLRLFEEMRFTKTVSVWPVGIVGGLKFEGPQCNNGKVTSWYTAWKPERPFPIDMAGFATNIGLVLNNPEASFSNHVQRGYQESHFLSKITTEEDLEAKANDCSEILVWHTRTEKPNMKQEQKLEKLGKASDPHMEV